MSIINVGDIPINENLVDGTELARRLERLYAAFHSQNSNATRPPSVTAGGIWSKTVTGGFEVMLFDGTNDVKIGEVIGGAVVINSNFVNLAYTGTLTGGTGVINIGSGQIYKDADGNVGIGNVNPFSSAAYSSLDVGGSKRGIVNLRNAAGSAICQIFVDSADVTNLYGTGAVAFTASSIESMRLNSTGLAVGHSNPAGRVDVLANAYGTFIARSASAGAATDVIAMKAVDSGASNFANAAYQARSHVWGINGSTLGMELDNSANLKFNSGYGSVATAYGCRAWVNFNGTGTVAIAGSGNVSSITDLGVGNYTVNFATAMPNANYGVVGWNNGYGVGWYDGPTNAGSVTVKSVNNSFAQYDTTSISVAIFR